MPSTVKPHVCNPNPSITVTTPNGGEVLMQGSDCEITWKSSKTTGNVKIELLKNSSVDEVLSDSESDDGNFNWSLTKSTSTGTNFKIRITNIADGSIKDESNDVFSINEEIIINGDYTENFDTLESGSEALPAGYIQSSSDDFNWLVLSGPTPSKTGSSPNVTGPDGDFTSGGANGNYLYVEASDPNNPGKDADFETPKINISSLENPELTFYYHMFSDSGHMGALNVDICKDGEWTNGELLLDDSDYGDEWKKSVINLSSYRLRSEWIKIRYRATTGESWASDICIDGIEVKGNPVDIIQAKVISKGLTLNYHNSQLRYSIPESLIGESIKISIFNMQGKEIYKNSLNLYNSTTGSFSLMSDDIANGVYTAQVKVGNATKLVNFIVSR